jgi:hypothetical protein
MLIVEGCSKRYARKDLFLHLQSFSDTFKHTSMMIGKMKVGSGIDNLIILFPILTFNLILALCAL